MSLREASVIKRHQRAANWRVLLLDRVQHERGLKAADEVWCSSAEAEKQKHFYQNGVDDSKSAVYAVNRNSSVLQYYVEQCTTNINSRFAYYGCHLPDTNEGMEEMKEMAAQQREDWMQFGHELTVQHGPEQAERTKARLAEVDAKKEVELAKINAKKEIELEKVKAKQKKKEKKKKRKRKRKEKKKRKKAKKKAKKSQGEEGGEAEASSSSSDDSSSDDSSDSSGS